MTTWFTSIFMGVVIYMGIALFTFIPGSVISQFRHRAINPIRFLVQQMFCLYMCCLFSVVFLPLPSMSAAQNLTYQYQLIPFYFVYDIATDFSMSAILGELFNIAMTVPFGLFLSYYFRLDKKAVVIAGFALTLFIEIGQLTGLFFLYSGSYRIFDVDDLIANTAGALIGYLFFCVIRTSIPAVEHFDLVAAPHRRTRFAR